MEDTEAHGRWFFCLETNLSHTLSVSFRVFRGLNQRFLRGR